MNAFNLFEIQVTFPIDQENLERKYLALSQQHHPDRIPQGTTRERLEATLATATLNEAYALLTDPLKRGYHLLNLLDPSLQADKEQTIKDIDLLKEAMDDREALEDATTESLCHALIQKTESKRDQTYHDIQKAFELKTFSEAQRLLYRYRYYEKVLTDANKKLQNHAFTA